MRTRHLLAAAALAAVSSGCGLVGSTDSAHEPHATPTRSGYCNDLPNVGADPGMVIGTDWSAEHHAYGDGVVLDACVTTSGGGRVAMTSDGKGITVRPHVVTIDPSGNGVIPFHVTVRRGATGGIRVQQSGPGISGSAPGPDVVTDGDGWRFAAHRD
jgi:hypothetical protein